MYYESNFRSFDYDFYHANGSFVYRTPSINRYRSIGEIVMNVAVFFSGRGSNMRKLFEMAENENNVNIVVAVTDNPQAQGMEIAFDYQTPVVVLPMDKERIAPYSWSVRIVKSLMGYGVELVVLAGFMKILPSYFCTAMQDRIVNIHPSLLPKHKGLHTHQRAIDAGDEYGGCSVHFVIPELDSGAVVAQEEVRILSNDNADTLAYKVLKNEHLMYPAIVRLICNERLICRDGIPFYQSQPLIEPFSMKTMPE